LANEVINNVDEVERQETCFKLIKTMVTFIKMPNSFYYNTDSIKHLGVLKDNKGTFKLFVWHLKKDDVSYRYYGVIQKNNPEKVEYFPFFDFSDEISNAKDSILTNKRWFGAHYYEMVEHKTKGERTYTLLGWKNYGPRSNKKVIDVLSFAEDGTPIFGRKDFFENPVEEKKRNPDIPLEKVHRVIFEFMGEASMILRYLPKEKMIVFDHLVPINETARGFFEAYIPDLSYDGLKFKKGKWELVENLKLENPPSPLDKLYQDPNKK
jgi:hypothetical protein